MVFVEKGNTVNYLAITEKSQMAQSIKLNNNMYWDISSIHGTDLITQTLNVPSNTTMTIGTPENAKAIIFSIPLGSTVDGFGIFAIGRQGGTTRIRKAVVPCSLVTLNTSDGSTVENKITNSTAYSVRLLILTNYELTFT